MKIYQAETGKQVEVYNLPPNESIQSLKKILASSINVPSESQILLSAQGVKLEDSNPISHYEKQDIFVFNRLTFINRQFTISSLKQPSPLNLPNISEISFPPEVYERAGIFIDFAKKFYYHTLIAEAVLKAEKSRRTSILSSFEEQTIQLKAIEAAVANLCEHYGHSSHNLDNFKQRYAKHMKRFETILASFDKDLAYLKEKELHPKLKTASRQTLSDCIPEKHLRLFTAKFAKDLDSYKKRVEEGLKFGDEVDKAVNKEKDFSTIINFKELEQIQLETNKCFIEQQQIADQLKKDYSLFQSVMERPQHQSSEKVLISILKNHEDYIETLKQNDEKLRKAIIFLGQSKIKLTQKLFDKLKIIAEIQSNIKQLGKRVMTFHTVLNTLLNKFAYIELVHYFPGAYSITLLEIARRRAFQRRYNTQIRSLVKNVQQIREEEIELRKKFTKNIQKYLPNNLIPGIEELPPQYQLTALTPTDSMLPQIDGKVEYNRDDVNKLFGSEFSEIDLHIYNDSHFENDLFHRIDGSFEKENHLHESERIMFESKIKSLQEQIKILEQERLSHSQEIENEYKKLIEEKEKKIQEQLKKISSLENEINKRTSPMSDIQAVKELTQENNLLKNKIKQIEKQLQDASKRINVSSVNSETKTFDELKETLNKQTEYLNHYKEDVDKLKKEKEELLKQVQLKEQLRHETALNSAQVEKKLYNLSKEHKKMKEKLDVFSKILKKVANICQLNEIVNNLDGDVKEAHLQKLVQTVEHMNRQLVKYSVKLSELELSDTEIKLSLNNFQLSSYAIFIPNERGHYEAINKGCPNYFLSMEVVRSIERGENIVKYVIGKIFYIESKIASKDSNPYGLREGTKYFIVTADIMDL